MAYPHEIGVHRAHALNRLGTVNLRDFPSHNVEQRRFRHWAADGQGHRSLWGLLMRQIDLPDTFFARMMLQMMARPKLATGDRRLAMAPGLERIARIEAFSQVLYDEAEGNEVLQEKLDRYAKAEGTLKKPCGSNRHSSIA